MITINGASGRTRTDEYEFTKLVLWLLRHRGEMASAAGIAPATSTFAWWRSDLTELRGQLGVGPTLASVIGLAPIRPDLKGRLRELLCIHGQKWSPRLVSRQRLLVFSEALICLSYSGELAHQAEARRAKAGLPRRSLGEGWSSRQVTLLRHPVISRVLCF